MSDAVLSILCLVATLVLYYANKKLYRRFHKLPLMPLVFTPILLVLILVLVFRPAGLLGERVANRA